MEINGIKWKTNQINVLDPVSSAKALAEPPGLCDWIQHGHLGLVEVAASRVPEKAGRPCHLPEFWAEFRRNIYHHISSMNRTGTKQESSYRVHSGSMHWWLVISDDCSTGHQTTTKYSRIHACHISQKPLPLSIAIKREILQIDLQKQGQDELHTKRVPVGNCSGRCHNGLACGCKI